MNTYQLEDFLGTPSSGLYLMLLVQTHYQHQGLTAAVSASGGMLTIP